MMKLPLRLVPPATVNRTVTPTRRPNADYRTREHLTQAEVDRLIKAAGKDLDDARRMAEEALAALHVDGLLSDGDALPEATSLEDVITANPVSWPFSLPFEPSRRAIGCVVILVPVR